MLLGFAYMSSALSPFIQSISTVGSSPLQAYFSFCKSQPFLAQTFSSETIVLEEAFLRTIKRLLIR